jgi:hypothetical protein
MQYIVFEIIDICIQFNNCGILMFAISRCSLVKLNSNDYKMQNVTFVSTLLLIKQNILKYKARFL